MGRCRMFQLQPDNPSVVNTVGRSFLDRIQDGERVGLGITVARLDQFLKSILSQPAFCNKQKCYDQPVAFLNSRLLKVSEGHLDSEPMPKLPNTYPGYQSILFTSTGPFSAQQPTSQTPVLERSYTTRSNNDSSRVLEKRPRISSPIND
jgi:hypothetical protein